MGSTCKQLLELCLRGEAWSSELLDRAIAEDDGRALMSVVVERLGDLFEPRLCRTYDELFSQVVARVCPDLAPRVKTAGGTPVPPTGIKYPRIYVLSRITLGADVAVTSVLLDAAKRRYPDAEIVFVGPRKNYEMFEADARVTHRDVPYARGGTLAERLRSSAALWFDDGIVLDPDSRLTQLGLIPVCPDENYFFFESRSYGGQSRERLPGLAARWFGDMQARPYVAPRPATGEAFDITVSLGVGENPAKRLGDEFERDLMRLLAETGASVLVDLGGSDEERARVERVLQPGMQTHQGSFAPFAAEVARSKLFVGYDSAAGHVASACGVQLISFAEGFVSERMFHRWRPLGTILAEGDAEHRLKACATELTYTFRR